MSQKDMRKAKKRGVRYPWDKWFKLGKRIRLVRGEDYLGATHGMRSTATQAANRMGYKVSFQLTADSLTMRVVGRKAVKK